MIPYCLSISFCRAYLEFFHDLKVDGLENIPSGSCIYASNHVSFYDPPIVGVTLGFPINYFARKTLFDVPLLGWMMEHHYHCIPINQERPDMVGTKKVIQLVKGGNSVLVFPEGGRTMDGNLQPGKPGVGMIVAKTGVPVVPMRIFGGYEAWPRGGKIKLFTPIRMVIGKPITFNHLPANRDSYQAISDGMMEAIAKLKIDGME